MKNARSVIATVLLAVFFTAACDDDNPATKSMLEDRVLGKADAPITIIEYASLTCPHCAHFHTDVLPLVKRNWIDTGKAKLIYREYPLDNAAKTASVIARCAPPEKYFDVLKTFFSRQNAWARLDDPLPMLVGLVEPFGLDRAAINACLDNDALVDGVLQMRLDGQSEYGIDSTPSFVIQGRLMRGALGYKEFDQVLRAAKP